MPKVTDDYCIVLYKIFVTGWFQITVYFSKFAFCSLNVVLIVDPNHLNE